MAQPEAAILFRTSSEQREALKAEAQAQGLTVQELLELKIFNELRPRERKRRRPGLQEELPIAG